MQVLARHQLINSLLIETLGLLSASNKLQTPYLTIGIPSTLLCFEMSLVAILHMWAYSWRPYAEGDPTLIQGVDQNVSRNRNPLKGILDALNPWDLVKAVGRSMKWIFNDRRRRMNNASYAELSSITNKDGTRASTKRIHSVDREVTSDLQFGTSWAEVDVTDDAPHRHN